MWTPEVQLEWDRARLSCFVPIGHCATVPILSGPTNHISPIKHAAILNQVPQTWLRQFQLILTCESPILGCPTHAWYHWGLNIAWVSLRQTQAEIDRCICHEVGHHYWRRLQPWRRRAFIRQTYFMRGGPNDWTVAEERFADLAAVAVINQSITCLNILLCPTFNNYYQHLASRRLNSMGALTPSSKSEPKQ